jgi:DNA-binding NarL/FixJ family response regulator/signal transduction histidine kinase
VGSAEARARGDTLVRHAVETGGPVICEDVAADERFARCELLIEHAAVSGVVIAIQGRRAPYGAFSVFSRQARRFSADEVNFVHAVVNVIHGAIERAQFAQRARDARDSERRRIARELHDETLQDLTVALARAARGAPDGGAVDEGLVAMLGRVGEQVRAAIYDLRLSDARNRTFAGLLEELVGLHRSIVPGCDIDVAITGLPEHLPADIGTDVLRIIGEAVTNARRHAEARRIEVRVAESEGSLVASVADDGRGFDATDRSRSVSGHGITGMRERADLLGGRLDIGRRAGGGTVVELRAPLAEPEVSSAPVRVLLVDDHAAIREAMAIAFADDAGFVIAGQAGSLAEARTSLDGVDVAIVDLGLPDGSGTELIGELRSANPDVQVLVLSANVDRAATARAVEKGAAGVLDKATHLHDVVAAVRRLRRGDTLMPLDEVVQLLRFAGRERERELDQRRLIDSLTGREREVLQLLADGLDGRRIAARLHISPRTQRNHVANILTKLGVHSQLQALVFALRHGLVEVPRGAASQD